MYLEFPKPLGDKGRTWLANIFKKITATAKLSKTLRKTEAIAFFKPGKVADDPNSYKSVTSLLGDRASRFICNHRSISRKKVASVRIEVAPTKCWYLQSIKRVVSCDERRHQNPKSYKSIISLIDIAFDCLVSVLLDFSAIIVASPERRWPPSESKLHQLNAGTYNA